MASISNPIRQKKRKPSWLIPFIILMVIGLPFMLFAFSPCAVVPQEAQLVDDAAIFLDGNHAPDSEITLSAEQLLPILAQSPRSRRPDTAKSYENEALCAIFTLAAADESASAQPCEMHIFHDVALEGVSGYIQIGQFAYQLKDAANLETQIRTACEAA